MHTAVVYERLHHMQLVMPPGQEDSARAFYVGVLGMGEIAKPPALATRGGAWFRAGGLERLAALTESPAVFGYRSRGSR